MFPPHFFLTVFGTLNNAGKTHFSNDKTINVKNFEKLTMIVSVRTGY